MGKIISVVLVILALVGLTGCLSRVGIASTQENYENAPSKTTNSEPGGQSVTSTDKEIAFRGLAWDIDSKAAENALLNDSENPRVYVYEKTAIPQPSTALDLDPSDNIVGEAGTTISLLGVTAGGYETLECRMYFKFAVNDSVVDRENDSFYLATYSFQFADATEVYQGLFDSLSELYGVGSEEVWDSYGYIVSSDFSGPYTAAVKETTWTGANNTFVTLRCKTSENEYAWCGVWMAYGKSDVAEDLQELKRAIQREYAEQEKAIGDTKTNAGL